MALFFRQVSRLCWKNREDDRLPSGIRVPLFFFSPLSVAPVTQSSPLPLQKIFFLENYIPILSFLADIFERDLPMRFKRSGQ